MVRRLASAYPAEESPDAGDSTTLTQGDEKSAANQRRSSSFSHSFNKRLLP